MCPGQVFPPRRSACSSPAVCLSDASLTWPTSVARHRFYTQHVIRQTDHPMNRQQSLFTQFLARDAFVKTNPRAIVMMFVCPSVRLSGTGVHCDHAVH